MYSKAKGYLCLPWDIKWGIMHSYPTIPFWMSIIEIWELGYLTLIQSNFVKKYTFKKKFFIRSNETHIGKAKAKYIALASLLLMIGRTILYRLVGQTWMPENLAPSAFLCFLLLFLAISPLYTHWQKFSRVLSFYLLNEYMHLS